MSKRIAADDTQVTETIAEAFNDYNVFILSFLKPNKFLWNIECELKEELIASSHYNSGGENRLVIISKSRRILPRGVR